MFPTVLKVHQAVLLLPVEHNEMSSCKTFSSCISVLYSNDNTHFRGAMPRKSLKAGGAEVSGNLKSALK